MYGTVTCSYAESRQMFVYTDGHAIQSNHSRVKPNFAKPRYTFPPPTQPNAL
jgi:hypothetical protein